jgi:hypothetical protein
MGVAAALASGRVRLGLELRIAGALLLSSPLAATVAAPAARG